MDISKNGIKSTVISKDHISVKNLTTGKSRTVVGFQGFKLLVESTSAEVLKAIWSVSKENIITAFKIWQGSGNKHQNEKVHLIVTAGKIIPSFHFCWGKFGYDWGTRLEVVPNYIGVYTKARTATWTATRLYR